MVSIRIVSEILKPQMSSGRGCRGEGRADVRLEARVGWGGVVVVERVEELQEVGGSLLS